MLTRKVHGTNYALIVGLLEMKEDVSRISQSFEIAHKNETIFIFEKAKLKNYHLNSVQLNLTEKKGTHLSIKWRINWRFNHKYCKY